MSTDLNRQSRHSSKRGTSQQNWLSKCRRWIRYWYLRLMRQNSSPQNLAAALALGLFIGAMPIIPFQSVVVISLAFIFRVNKFAAWLATCYSNAATMVPFYYFLYKIGIVFLPFNVVFDPNNLEMEQMISSGWDVFIVMLTGGVLFGLPAAIMTYFISLIGIKAYRQRQSVRLQKKRSEASL